MDEWRITYVNSYVAWKPKSCVDLCESEEEAVERIAWLSHTPYLSDFRIERREVSPWTQVETPAAELQRALDEWAGRSFRGSPKAAR